MARVALTAPLWVLALGAVMALGGCAGPVTTYHDIEGGAIAQTRQPPPGADLPYPNLAEVPPAPAPLTAAELQAVGARLAPVPAPEPAMVPNAAALAGLTLPDGPPPAPVVPDISIPNTPTPHVITYAAPPPPPAVAAKPADGTPLALGFAPGSAVLDAGSVDAVTKLAVARGAGAVLAGGFGAPGAVADAAALQLALLRARAIADALTAAGVPAADVRMVAASDGAGGFAQVVY